MKKWHMEGIISSVGEQRKLALPKMRGAGLRARFNFSHFWKQSALARLLRSWFGCMVLFCVL